MEGGTGASRLPLSPPGQMPRAASVEAAGEESGLCCAEERGAGGGDSLQQELPFAVQRLAKGSFPTLAVAKGCG